MDRVDSADAIYLDLRKAFDKVPHNRLITKLRGYGIAGNLLAWISCFLTDRAQQVRLDGCMSPARSVLSGVPRGSVLGPIPFLFLR